LVLMDVDMPRMNGITATRKIRESGGRHANVTIIGMSAHAPETVGKECLAAGMDEYLMKPIDRSVMYKAFSRHLRTNDTAEPNLPQGPAAKPIELLDRTAIDQLARDAGSEALPSMFRTFIDEMTERVKKMSAALEGRDFELLGSQSHALKSSAATFGFPQVATLATLINDANHDGKLATVIDAFQTLEVTVESSIKDFRNEWQRLAPLD